MLPQLHAGIDADGAGQGERMITKGASKKPDQRPSEQTTRDTVRTLEEMPSGLKLKDIAEVVEDNMGFLKINKVLFRPVQISGDLTQTEVDAFKEQMKAYFTAKIEVFDEEPQPVQHGEERDARSQTDRPDSAAGISQHADAAEAAVSQDAEPGEQGAAEGSPQEPASDASDNGVAPDTQTRDREPAPASQEFDLAHVFWNAESHAREEQAHLQVLRGTVQGLILAAIIWIGGMAAGAGQGVGSFLLVMALAFGAFLLRWWPSMARRGVFQTIDKHVLPNGYRDSGIWPGFLEERFIKDVKNKFPGVDEDVRSLTDVIAELFLVNLKKFVAHKRSYQEMACSRIITAYRLISWFLIVIMVIVTMTVHTALSNPVFNIFDFNSFYYIILLSIIVFSTALLALISKSLLVYFVEKSKDWSTLFYFDRDNRDYAHRAYENAITVTCVNVSHAISSRMQFLGRIITEFKNKQSDLVLNGENIGKSTTDEDMEGHRGFFFMQAILWLSKRSEYQQLYLVDKMQEMQRDFFILDMEGYRKTFSIAQEAGWKIERTAALILIAGTCVLGLPILWPILGSILGPVSPMAPASAKDILIHAVTFFGVGLPFGIAAWLLRRDAIKFTNRFSARSYSNPDWNPEFRRLQAALNTESWETFNKLRVDRTLSAQYQRALGAIYIAKEMLSSKRGL